MSLLLLLGTVGPAPEPPVIVEIPVGTSTAWFPRPERMLDVTRHLPLAQVLVWGHVDSRRLYDVADENGITDLRHVAPGRRLLIPAS